jgi:hypothetical protein
VVYASAENEQVQHVFQHSLLLGFSDSADAGNESVGNPSTCALMVARPPLVSVEASPVAVIDGLILGTQE